MMGMRTVTHIGAESTPIPPPGWGAVEKWVVEVASRINKRYKVRIISIPSDNRTRIPNTEFIYMPRICSVCKSLADFERTYVRKYLRVSPVRSCLNWKQLPSWSYARCLKREIGRHETDIFHFHQRPDYIHLTRPEKPVVIHLHNKIPGLTPNFPLFPGFFKGIELSDMVITVSEELRRYYIGEGVDKDKIRVLYNGVDTKRYRPVTAARKPSGLRLLFVGKLIERKGVVHLLKAFRKIKGEVPDAELFIVGRKDEKSGYFREVQRNMTEGVTLAGVVGEDELIRHYQKATMLVHPPTYEAFGMTLVEAMACGTPVVATSVGGIPEVLGDDGVLVKPGSAEAIAKAVLKLAGDKKRYQKLARRSRQRVEENFSWESVVKRLSSLYEEILG
jgi:glycosyltransferase involved in cell wall biosynthesis